MQWWTMAEFDVTSNLEKKKYVVKIAKVCSRKREIDKHYHGFFSK